MKGQILTGQLIGWGVSIALASVGFVGSKVFDHESRLSKVETRIERMPVIEAKLDALLEKQNINPSQVERQQYSLNTNEKKSN